jgi:hypothetical protein
VEVPRTIKFKIGQLVITPRALAAIADSGENPWQFVVRHMAGDWGDLCPEDKQLNEDALKQGERIFSAYHTAKGVKLYCITEADRSSTAILLPAEY